MWYCPFNKNKKFKTLFHQHQQQESKRKWQKQQKKALTIKKNIYIKKIMI